MASGLSQETHRGIAKERCKDDHLEQVSTKSVEGQTIQETAVNVSRMTLNYQDFLTGR